MDAIACLVLLASWLPVAMLSDTPSVNVGGGMVDLTHTITRDSPIPPWWPRFNFSNVLTVNISEGVIAEGNAFSLPEHSGTHIDAPKHFCPNGKTLEQIPIEQFSGPGAVMNFRPQAEENNDYEVTIEDLRKWESYNGRIPDNAILMLNFGWDKHWPNLNEIYQTESFERIHYPGLAPNASRWLTRNRNVRAVGTDTPSIDNGATTLYETHVDLCRSDKIIIEFVANLGKLPPVGTWIFIGSPKLGNGTGIPSRVFAILDSGASISSSCSVLAFFVPSFIIFLTFW